MSEMADAAPVTIVAQQVQVTQPEKDRQSTQPETDCVVENKTARSLRIIGNHAPLVIAPFGTRRIKAAQYKDYQFQPWIAQGLIDISFATTPTEESKAPSTDKSKGKFKLYTTIAAALVGVGLIGMFLPRIIAWLTTVHDPVTMVLSGFPLFLFLILAAPLALTAVYLNQNRSKFRQGVGALALGLVAVSVIAVAAIGPVLTMMSFRQENENVTGRAMQMVFVVIAALLPALLYFLYDRQKVSIVSKTFYREIVLLDPAIHTSQDAEEKYGHLINEVYGDKSAGYYLANVGLPITLSSVLIALGWLLILLPVVPERLADFFNIASPSPTALSFGFLGAYFFALNMVFRRYVRSDLTPKAYSHITVRLLITSILVWAVSVLPTVQSNPPSPALLIMAFCIGVVPETATKVIQEFMRKTIGHFSESLDERDPLTNLEGIDLYDRARLSEEGVGNIENLAYHNLIDLLVQTRIPARRLADMVDQAILYLHLRGNAPPVQAAPQPADQPPATTPDNEAVSEARLDKMVMPAAESGKDEVSALEYLRSYGIRTATDLLYAWRRKDQQVPSDFEKALQNQSKEFAARINVIVDTLEEADWMPQLLYRRAQVTMLHERPVEDPDEFFRLETDAASQTA